MDLPTDEDNIRTFLESRYRCYNLPEFIHSDPLEIVLEYDHPAEREVVALLTSSLSYGQVSSIKNSVRELLDRLEEHPLSFLQHSRERGINEALSGFRHRFTGEEDMAQLLKGIRRVLNTYGRLENAFTQHVNTENDDYVPALSGFVDEIAPGRKGIPHLLPHPAKGSACKRLWLFLRWMIRSDAVDPGGWPGLTPRKLLIPMDVHMGRICRRLSFLNRSQTDLKAAKQATNCFRRYRPDDPVRYDFALTRAVMYEGMKALDGVQSSSSCTS